MNHVNVSQYGFDTKEEEEERKKKALFDTHLPHKSRVVKNRSVM